MSRPSIAIAELPGGAGRGQDRCRTADGLVIVLDGASAFDKKANPDASHYVDHLADELLRTYVEDPRGDLADGLARAIEATAKTLDITPGRGPSSTVAVVRWGTQSVDTLVLGDSSIIVCSEGGRDVLRDDAISAIAPEIRRRYRDHLSFGGGFGQAHRDDLAELQRHQATRRNRAFGYWIAEAEPEAARHALVRNYARDDVKWCVAVTDGAQRLVDYLGYDWGAVAKLEADRVYDLLIDLHHWENSDPEGVELPRSKRHDDKTLAAILRPRE